MEKKDENVKHQADLQSGSEVKNTKTENAVYKFFKNIKYFILSNFTVYGEIAPIMEKLSNIEKYMLEIRLELEEEIQLVTKDLEMYKTILEVMAKELPDMFWLKLKDGTYKIANDTIIEKLLLDRHPFGKTDVELANAAKERFGSENHTFGEKCANSDSIVASTLQNQRFLESGKVKGKMLYLEVYKAPLIVDGEFVGVFGSGRDMTEYVEAYMEQREILEKYAPGITTKLDNIFTRYAFESDFCAHKVNK